MTNGNIDFTKSSQYTLSIRLSTDGFSFSVYNPLEECDFYFQTFAVNTQQSMAANVKAFLAQTAELKYTYRQVNILIPLYLCPIRIIRRRADGNYLLSKLPQTE